MRVRIHIYIYIQLSQDQNIKAQGYTIKRMKDELLEIGADAAAFNKAKGKEGKKVAFLRAWFNLVLLPELSVLSGPDKTKLKLPQKDEGKTKPSPQDDDVGKAKAAKLSPKTKDPSLKAAGLSVDDFCSLKADILPGEISETPPPLAKIILMAQCHSARREST